MPRSKSRKTSRPGCVRLPRFALLPLTNDYIRQQSLASHMALVVCGTDEGNRHSFHELIRIMYLAYLLWEDGFGQADVQLFVDSEVAMNAAVARVQESKVWRLEKNEGVFLEKIVRLHDEQLAAVPTRFLLAAEARLEVLLSKPRVFSPIRSKLPTPGEQSHVEATV
jgi:hypothetical protein